MTTSRLSTPWRERLASALTWHYAGFAVLLLLVAGLAVRLGLDWAAPTTAPATHWPESKSS